MIEITQSMYLLNGSEVSWDARAKAGFVCVEHDIEGCCWATHRTVEIRPMELMVDLDQDGRVRGIEVLGHEPGVWDLLDVIRWLSDERASTRYRGRDSAVSERMKDDQ